MISTKGRYGLRVMIDLAQHRDQGLVPLKDIAARQEISKKYLEIIVRDLVKGGLIAGQGGRGGGYSLCRETESYTVLEILELLEGSLCSVSCLDKNAPACPRAGTCKSLPLWKEHDKMVHDFFAQKKLSDLL